MFAFSEYSKLGGRVSKIDAPFSEYGGEYFTAGQADSLWTAAWRYGEDLSERNTAKLSPDFANKMYGIPGQLQFTEDIPLGRAILMRDRKTKELQRAAYLDSIRESGARTVAGFGMAMLGSMLNPIDLGFAFVPIVGTEKAAATLTKAGAAGWRVRLAKGLVTSEEALLARGVPWHRVTASIVDGTVGAAMTEIPVFIQKTRDQAIYGPADALLNIAAGGLFGGAMRLTGLAIERGMRGGQKLLDSMTPEGRAMADVKAMNDFLTGRKIDVAEVVELDENIIKQRVQFDEAKAREEAEVAVREEMPEEPSARPTEGAAPIDPAAAQSNPKFADDPNYQAGFQRGVEMAKQGKEDPYFETARFMTDEELSMVERVGSVTPDEFQKVVESQGLVAGYRSVRGTPQRPPAPDSVKAERVNRINQYIERKRAEATEKARSDLIAEQQAQGRILPQEEVDRLSVKETPGKADVETLKADVDTMLLNSGLTTELLDEVARAHQMDPKRFSFEPDSIKAAVDCIIQNLKDY